MKLILNEEKISICDTFDKVNLYQHFHHCILNFQVRAHYRDVLRSSFDMAGSQGVVDYTMILNYMKRFRSMN